MERQRGEKRLGFCIWRKDFHISGGRGQTLKNQTKQTVSGRKKEGKKKKQLTFFWCGRIAHAENLKKTPIAAIESETPM